MLIERFINTLTQSFPSINIFLAFFLSRTFLNFLFASPFDLINIVDGGSVYAIIIFMIYRQKKSQLRTMSATKYAISN